MKGSVRLRHKLRGREHYGTILWGVPDGDCKPGKRNEAALCNSEKLSAFDWNFDKVPDENGVFLIHIPAPCWTG